MHDLTEDFVEKTTTRNKVIYEAERNILAIAVHSVSAGEEIFITLESEDFENIKHQIIYKALINLFNEKNAIDATTLSNYLLHHNALEKIGGIDYLVDLMQIYTTDSSLDDYLTIITQNTVNRNLRALLAKLQQDIHNNEPIDEIVNFAEKQILDVRRERRNNLFKSSSQEVEKTLAKIELLQNSKNLLTGVTSGFFALDQMTSGFQKGDLIILAARPSMGKTALALNFALNCAQKDKKGVAIFSVEMPAEQLILRLLGTISTVDSQKVRTGKNLSTTDWTNLTKAADALKHTKLYIDDTPGLKILELQSKLRKLCREQEIGLVIIDYLQLLSISNSIGESRQQEISTISRQLKALAREIEIPIICLSQLSRSVEKREDKRPIMSDLRDSGAIEQDADIIMFLYREDYYNVGITKDLTQRETETAELIISKHRNGPTGSLELLFIRKHGSFANHGNLQNF